MNDTSAGGNCALMSWGMAALAGVLAFVLLLVLGDWRVIQAIFAGLVILVVLGVLFSWLFCAPMEAPAAPATVAAPRAAPAPSPEPSPAPEAAAPAPEPAPAHEPAPASGDDSSVVKPSARLPGEEELAGRKGSWRYDGDGDDGGEAIAKPDLMQSAPDDGGDDLKQIKGIGPKLEQVCNGLGIYRFAQIASWTEAEVAWVDANIEGFKGRVTRDAWVEQAKVLAGGGETDFSKRVDKGDVY